MLNEAHLGMINDVVLVGLPYPLLNPFRAVVATRRGADGVAANDHCSDIELRRWGEEARNVKRCERRKALEFLHNLGRSLNQILERRPFILLHLLTDETHVEIRSISPRRYLSHRPDEIPSPEVNSILCESMTLQFV